VETLNTAQSINVTSDTNFMEWLIVTIPNYQISADPIWTVHDRAACPYLTNEPSI